MDKEEKAIAEIYGEMAVKMVHIYLPRKQSKFKSPLDKREDVKKTEY